MDNWSPNSLLQVQMQLVSLTYEQGLFSLTVLVELLSDWPS